jgi:hypothetical protein
MVGMHVTCKLTLPIRGSDVIEGTLFTYDAESTTLVLLVNAGSDRPTVRAVSAKFIKEIEMQDAAAEHALPMGIAAGAALPSLHGDDSLQKRTNKNLRQAEDKRKYANVCDVSIEACEVFDRLSRVMAGVTWSVDPDHLATVGIVLDEDEEPASVINVGNEVIIAEFEGSWRTPTVVASKEGAGVGADRISRIKQVIASAFPAA